ncbi:uncharacterized protein [Dendropsophus ebraccatus]|uniref:uncharacterized protein isoform X2 n=1 Tax=Dendropsophus ebraccatus TaxID=150705 RepID=UPI0038317096
MDEQSPEEPAFFCHLCQVSCASALNLQSHFLGVKHKKVEEAIRCNITDKDPDEEELLPIDLKPNVTLQDHIDACKNSEPAVGLEYIYQYRRHGYNTYECKLCECRAGLTHMFMHIIGAKHRIYYLGKHHPTLGICGPYIMKGPKKLKKLRDVCLEVEKQFGRQKINVMDNIDSQGTFISDLAKVYYTPDSEVKVDFTSDDFFDTGDKTKATEDKPEVTEEKTKPFRRVFSFLELKAAHEARLKWAAESDNTEQNSEAQEQDTEKKEDKDEECEKNEEVHSKEPCKSNQDFRNNKELFNFLEHFSIVEEEDAKFVNTVVEMLTSALLRHHKSCKDNKEKKLDPVLSDRPPHTNQESALKSDPPLNNQTPILGSSSTTAPNQTPESLVKSNGPSATYNPAANIFAEDIIDEFESGDTENKSKTQLFPVSSSSDRKKLKFTLSSNKPQESGVKFKQRQRAESNGPSATFNPAANIFSEDIIDEFESGDAAKRVYPKPPPSKSDNRRPASKSKPSSSRASDSRSHYKMHPQHRGLQREVNSSVRGMTTAQTPVYSAPQVNRGTPFTQPRFAPPNASFPPRPPLFPIAKDDPVSKFFESIKNMEVSEVASTLSKITATNPAFKGIHVPSLIRYLTETGKLKQTPSTQQLNQ